MKKITFLLLMLLTASLGFAQNTSNYCSAEVFHLNIPAEVDSKILLTIENTGPSSMKMTAEAIDITYLAIEGPPIAGDPAKSAADTSVTGKISITLTWAGPPPTNVTFPYIQWRKTSTGGNTWQIQDATTPFAGVCGPPTPPEKVVTLSDLKLDGVTITGFGSTKEVYNIEVPLGGSTPLVTAVTPTNPGASVGAITQASAVPGSATFTVTSEDTTVNQIYTINFIQLFPTVAALTPPARAAADVVSIYSDAYAAINPINYDAGWCNNNLPGAVTATTAGGNAVFAYNDKDCQGMVFPDDLQDLTGFTHIHIDLFIKAGTDLVGKIFNMFTVPSSGGNSPFNIDINGLNPKPVPGTWYSYDVPVTFSGPTVNIKEFGVVTNMKNAVWYDNLYFHKNTTLGTKDFEIAGLNAFPNPTQDSWTLKTQSIKMLSITVYDILGKNVLSIAPNDTEATINGSQLKSGLYFAQIKTDSGVSSLKLVKQ